MKTVVLDVLDDSKFQLLIEFLQEIRFVRVERPTSGLTHVKKMNAVPQSILSPHTAKTFTMFSREELHVR